MTEICAGRSLGLYSAADFRVTTGAAASVGTLRQALWYFRDETIAAPIAGKPVASFTPGVRVDDDLRGWLAARHDDPQGDYPPLVWIAAPDAVVGAQLADNMAVVLAVILPTCAGLWLILPSFQANCAVSRFSSGSTDIWFLEPMVE